MNFFHFQMTLEMAIIQSVLKPLKLLNSTTARKQKRNALILH